MLQMIGRQFDEGYMTEMTRRRPLRDGLLHAATRRQIGCHMTGRAKPIEDQGLQQPHSPQLLHLIHQFDRQCCTGDVQTRDRAQPQHTSGHAQVHTAEPPRSTRPHQRGSRWSVGNATTLRQLGQREAVFDIRMEGCFTGHVNLPDVGVG